MEENEVKKRNIVKPYLGFIDTNVLFKKPVSCLMAVISLLIPVFFLVQIIQLGLFKSGVGELIAAGLLSLVVLIFSGVFGAGMWWYRRINRDDGTQWYPNFRRFIQTMGEWSGTMVAFIVFGCVLSFAIIAGDYIDFITDFLPVSVPVGGANLAIVGPICGFLIIIATKILLFLLDPIIWLIKQIWKLIVRLVLYFYRCITKIAGTVEQNTPVWIGVIWISAVAVAVCGLILLLKLITQPEPLYFRAGIGALALGLILIGLLVFKRKQYD